MDLKWMFALAAASLVVAQVDAQAVSPIEPAPPVPYTSAMDSMAKGQAYARAAAEARAQAARENLRRTVGGLVASGQCEDAKNTALRGGDFELARDALAMCQPTH
jgi:hypothetical protein